MFEWDGTSWIQRQKLTASDALPDANFGFAVAIDGDTIVVGARYDDQLGDRAGAAYVFVRDGANWTEQQKLTASDGTASHEFGSAVAIDGDTCVIGAYRDNSFTGAAYVFVRSGETWSEQEKITALNGNQHHWFGISVGIDNGIIAVGANNAERVYTFTHDGSAWMERQTLFASDAAGGDWFGFSLDIRGDSIVVGAFRNDDDGSSSGSAYVFKGNGTIWTQQQKLNASDAAAGDEFGYSVAIHEDSVAIGSRSDDDAGGESGSAYVFVRNGGTWSEEEKLTADDAAPEDEYGYSVDISGDSVVVGARSDDDGGNLSGSAYVYDLSLPVVPLVTMTVTSPSAPATLFLGDSVFSCLDKHKCSGGRQHRLIHEARYRSSFSHRT